MACTLWGSDRDPNFEYWDEAYWVLAQWLCQQLARVDDPQPGHIKDPGRRNEPCAICYDVSYNIHDGGLSELFQAFGSVAYSCGASGVPEPEAARRALSAMIAQAKEIERVKELHAAFHRL